MQSFTIASVLALAATATAQTVGFHAINLPGLNEQVPACTTYNIVWTPAASAQFAGPVVFRLIGGPTQNTQVDIGGDIGPVDGAAGSFMWNVPCDEGDKNFYGLKIILDSNRDIFQFSTPFDIVSVPTTSSTTSDDTYSTAMSNTTMTSMTSSASASSMSTSSNATFTTSQPSPSTTITSTTVVDPTTSDPATTTTALPAGANRAVAGSFAAVAVAAAFFAL